MECRNSRVVQAGGNSNKYGKVLLRNFFVFVVYAYMIGLSTFEITGALVFYFHSESYWAVVNEGRNQLIHGCIMYCFFPLVSFAKGIQVPKVCIITLGSNYCLSTCDACDLFGKAVCPADVSG